MPSLMDVPGLGGYLQAQQLGQQRDMGQLQQAQTLMGILSQVQQQQQRGAALQREQQFRGALSQLPPDASPEQLLQAVRPHASADDLLRITQSSQDRAAQREAAQANMESQREQARAMQQERLQQQATLAQQRSEDMRLNAQERNQARMDSIRLAASLRPARSAAPSRSTRSRRYSKGSMRTG